MTTQTIPAGLTPDEARALLDGTTPGPWEVDESDHHVWAIGPIDGSANGSELCCQITDARLAAHAPDMAHMIAGMRAEYRLEARDQHGKWHPGWWSEDPERCDDPCFFGLTITARRIVRRYVTEPEEA